MTTPSSLPAQEPRERRPHLDQPVRRGRLPRYALILLGVWLIAADSLVTTTIMPSVGRELGGFAYFAWATAGFFTGCILAGATAGRLSEQFGLRPATAAAGLVYALGCVMSAAAPDIGTFLAGRVIQGLGAGWVSGFAYVAIALVFPQRHLARVFASTTSIWGIATLFGPLVGGVFAQAHAWRGVFWMFGAQAVAFSVAAMVLLPKSARSDGAAGVPALQTLVLTAGVAALAVAGVVDGFGLAAALALLGLALLVATLRLDARAGVRLMPRDAGRPATIVGSGYLASFAMTAASMGLSIYGPAILQTIQGLSPIEAGYAIAAEAVCWTAAALPISGAGPKWASRWIILGGACIAVATVALMGMAECSVLVVVVLAGLMGTGFGLSYSFMSQRIIAALPEDDKVVGSSGIGAARQSASAAGSAIAGAAANFAGFRAGMTVESAQSTAIWVFATATPLALVGAWAAWRFARLSGPSNP